MRSASSSRNARAWWITSTWKYYGPSPMTMRNYWGKNILAQWCSVPAFLLLAGILWAAPKAPAASKGTPKKAAAAPASLATLVRAYRESLMPARRESVEAYAAAHARETGGALARLAL